jgi:hypothetical protein
MNQSARYPYRIHIGTTPTGKAKWSYFQSLRSASAFAGRAFQQHGIVLAVTETPTPVAKPLKLAAPFTF